MNVAEINPAFWINVVRVNAHTTDCAAKQTALSNAADHLERYVESLAAQPVGQVVAWRYSRNGETCGWLNGLPKPEAAKACEEKGYPIEYAYSSPAAVEVTDGLIARTAWQQLETQNAVMNDLVNALELANAKLTIWEESILSCQKVSPRMVKNVTDMIARKTAALTAALRRE